MTVLARPTRRLRREIRDALATRRTRRHVPGHARVASTATTHTRCTSPSPSQTSSRSSSPPFDDALVTKVTGGQGHVSPTSSGTPSGRTSSGTGTSSPTRRSQRRHRRRGRAAHEFPVPESLVEKFLDSFVEDIKSRSRDRKRCRRASTRRSSARSSRPYAIWQASGCSSRSGSPRPKGSTSAMRRSSRPPRPTPGRIGIDKDKLLAYYKTSEQRARTASCRTRSWRSSASTPRSPTNPWPLTHRTCIR